MPNEYRNFKIDGEDVWHALRRCDSTADEIETIRTALRAAYKLGREDESVRYHDDPGNGDNVW